MLLLFVGFVYGGARREVLDSTKQPERLKGLATEVKTHVQNSSWNDNPVKPVVVNYLDRTTRETVVATNYPLPTPFNPRLFDEKSKREDPQLFNAEELQVGSGFGSFAMRGTEAASPGSGGAKPPDRASQQTSGKRPTSHGFKPSLNSVLKTQAWAVVTGLVPVEKQTEEFARVFDHAMAFDPARDRPQYMGYQLERAEIAGSQPDKLDWKPVRNPNFEQDFAGNVDEVVGSEYVMYALTMPLGPLVGKNWGESVTHPKVPFAWAKAAQHEAEAAAGDKEKKDEAKEAPPEPTGGVIVTRQTKAKTDAAQSAASKSADAPPPIAYRLLRVFDFSVERGKRYRYRIKLALANPNFGVPPQNLKNPDNAPRPSAAKWC